MVDESLLNEKRDRVRRRGVASRHVTFGLDRGVVVGTLWLDFAAGVGMPNVMFHALRHTHASQLIDEGVNIVISGKRLGDAEPDVTLRISAHMFRKDDGKAAGAINAALNQ
jgi:integrase